MVEDNEIKVYSKLLAKLVKGMTVTKRNYSVYRIMKARGRAGMDVY
jgi:hypothetical protein